MKMIPSFRPNISYGELNAVLLRILSGDIAGRVILQFEDRFAQYLGVKHAVNAPSGRWALYYILKSLNLKEGDEVIIPAFTYFAVPAAIVKLGLRPVFVDINSENLNIDIQKIEENITEKTRVIIPTHLCGFVCEIDEILDIAQRQNIKVVEDCAQSLGTEYKGKKVGSLGEVSYFTFGITKSFTTLGGGMVTTDNDELAERVRKNLAQLRQTSNKALFFKLLEGYSMKFATSPILFPIVYSIIRIFSCFGVDIVDCIFHEKERLLGKLPRSGRLNNIQAELGVMQLNDLDRKNSMRMKKGLELYQRLEGIDNIRIPLLGENAKNIFSGCPILVKNKNAIRRKLLAKGIDVSSGYMQDCSKLDVFRGFKKGCPYASRAEDKILYFPIYAELTSSELTYIVNVVKNLAR
ncbi:MAG: hypothetical protein A2Z72_04655 [Omnitrophica bacterium RBG_13_46_9]|nr:MAG: hypothetical protein A2Z72_04655 [Omnitrophica bacterium RBG_13_46_9]